MSSSFIDQEKKKKESCVLVGVITDHMSDRMVKENMDELAFLAKTAGIFSKKTVTQRLKHPNARTFLGEGKLQEIANYLEENPVDCVIFDDALSPSQARNVEKMLKIPVIDRPGLILEIFAQRAKTAYAKTQVELAQYQYILPRLSKLWSHLERQGGVGMKGPGETQIETDRRIVRYKINQMRQKLKEIDQQMRSQRQNRDGIVKLALVGYTNVGKSTLMNLLSKSNVFAENKLFATLDTTVRKIVWNDLPFLLSDTVGFIRKLPHQLIESFKSTLEETKEADYLLHVIDVSHPDFEAQFEVVEQTLKEINADHIPALWIFNKIDQYPKKELEEYDLQPGQKQYMSLAQLQEVWTQKAQEKNAKIIFISATEKENIEELRHQLQNIVENIHYTRFPHLAKNNWTENNC